MTTTTSRVEIATDPAVNRAIDAATERRLAYYAGRPHEIGRRLRELDAEWDIERALEANAATLSLVGGVLGATRSRLWFMLPVGVAGFLLQHAVEGWCPPLPILRRMGFRTSREIERERVALRVLRGDFASAVEPGGSAEARAQAALAAVR